MPLTVAHSTAALVRNDVNGMCIFYVAELVYKVPKVFLCVALTAAW